MIAVREGQSRLCRCGCGERFVPTKKSKEFINSKHKDAYHNGRKRRIVVGIARLNDTNVELVVKYIEKLRKQQGV